MRFLRIPLLLGCFSLAAAAEPPQITVVDISQGGSMQSAAAINDWGDVVGQGNLGSGNHALLLRNGVLIDLATTSSLSNSRALSINRRGEIVGAGYDDAHAQQHAFFWDAEGIHDIHPAGSSYSYATAVNDGGDVVLNLNGSVNVWKDARLTPLGAGWGEAINRRGLVAGGLYPHAILWDDDRATALDVAESWATAVNERGDVVGYRWLSNALAEGFVVSHGQRTALPPLAGDVVALAYGIDKHGRIVGTSIWCEFECNLPRTRAVLWQDGLPFQLPGVEGSSACVARGINERGEIVGTCGAWCTQSGSCGGVTRAVLWRIE